MNYKEILTIIENSDKTNLIILKEIIDKQLSILKLKKNIKNFK